MNKRVIKFILFLSILTICSFFYFLNEQNYQTLKDIQKQIIHHPEFIPEKWIAKYSSFGFSNLRADIYWLESIQYIGETALGSEYKKYLFAMLDLITDLNPFFEKPYIIGQLLLPSYNERYESLTDNIQKSYIQQAEFLWLKWISNFCDSKKLELIAGEYDLNILWTDEKYKNPCKSSSIAFWQAFLYYFYMNNPEKSALYYKIASTNDDSLEGAKIMTAIMSGKSWNREKSIMMFLTLANQQKSEKSCKIMSTELQKLSYATFQQNIPLTSDIIKQLQNLQKQYFVFNPESDKEMIYGDNCMEYINKSIREFNLLYIEEANKKYFADTNENAKNAQILYEKKYIDFLPTDFQQYDTYGIIYVFNEKTQNFDYEMGSYK